MSNPAEGCPGSTMFSGRRLRVEVALTSADLMRQHSAWCDLVSRAADPNVFYEPYNLLAAIEAFGIERGSRFVFVFELVEGSNAARAIGFFPMELKKRFRGIPLKHFLMWQHSQLFLATPLVDAVRGVYAWQALFQWAREESHFIEIPLMLAGSATHRFLHDTLRLENGAATVVDRFDRALLVRDNSTSNEYCRKATSNNARQEWRRQRRRLAELGNLAVCAIQPADDAAVWLDWFMDLEAAGWKGGAGTALACSSSEERYFRSICTSAHRIGRLHMLGLFLDGRPVAMQCNLLSENGSFALKVAYDEAFGKYSPGVLLELDNIADMFRRSGFRWMDSCTMRGHRLMHRLWRDKRTIEHLLVAPGGGAGRYLVKLYPFMQALKRRLTAQP